METHANTLSLVGLGLEPGGIAVAGLEAARAARHVFLETYTAVSPVPIDELTKLVGSAVSTADRAMVEQGGALLDAAADGGACLLVAGYPLAATTHTALRLEALERGLKVAVHHAASVLCAAPAAAGLSPYRFGRTTTLVTPQPGFRPTSPAEVVVANLEHGLHSLVLLDIRPDGSMTAAEGAALLVELGRELGADHVNARTGAIALARVGRPDVGVWKASLGRLATLDAGEPMHSLIVPATLAEHEREAMEVLVTRLGDT